MTTKAATTTKDYKLHYIAFFFLGLIILEVTHLYWTALGKKRVPLNSTNKKNG